MRSTLKIVILVIGLMVPLFAAASELEQSANISLYPKPFEISDMVLKNTLGQNVSIKDFRGKVVLLHFWSIQCPACKIEEPLLDHIKKTLGQSGLEILAVNLVDPPQAVIQYAAGTKPPFPVLFGGGNGFSLRTVNITGKNTAFVVNPGQEAILEVPGFPTTYILDCRGSAVGYSVGAARWDHKAAVVFLQQLLGQSAACSAKASLPGPTFSMRR